MWSLKRGGLLIAVVTMAGLTVYLNRHNLVDTKINKSLAVTFSDISL